MRNTDPKGIPLARIPAPTITIETGDGTIYCAYKAHPEQDLYAVEKYVETEEDGKTVLRYYQGAAMVPEAQIETAEYVPAFYQLGGYYGA